MTKINPPERASTLRDATRVEIGIEAWKRLAYDEFLGWSYAVPWSLVRKDLEIPVLLQIVLDDDGNFEDVHELAVCTETGRAISLNSEERERLHLIVDTYGISDGGFNEQQ